MSDIQKPLREALRAYQHPSRRRSLWELAVTATPFALLWAAVFVSWQREWWWGLLLIAPAAGLLVRLFLIQHDCGHQAFFRSSGANGWLGRTIGVLTATPYDYWRRTHAMHHATSGNLDRRELGGIETLTVAEYRALSAPRRLAYRLYRHPAVMLGLGPGYMFALQHRLPIGLMRDAAAWRSVMGTNFALAALALPFILTGSFTALLATHVPILVLAATIGVWLFYVQHQFEGSYWARQPEWSSIDAALKGSSHLVLPAPLRWLSANIGIHHVHHLASRIPFYRLPEVLAREPAFRAGREVGLKESFSALTLSLWDEPSARLVPFSHLRTRARWA